MPGGASHAQVVRARAGRESWRPASHDFGFRERENLAEQIDDSRDPARAGSGWHRVYERGETWGEAGPSLGEIWRNSEIAEIFREKWIFG